MNKLIKGIVVVAAAAVASVSIAACSSSGSSSSDKKPVATIASLSGESTSVKLDSGFTGALTTLGLTPGVLGTATLANGSVHFPITGGHVTVYKKGAVDPYVQGDIEHNGSGLSLTAGTTVQLQNFDINPGSSQLFGDVSVNGTVAAKHAYLFNLDGSTLAPITISGGVATLTGTRVLVSDAAALLLTRPSTRRRSRRTSGRNRDHPRQVISITLPSWGGRLTTPGALTAPDTPPAPNLVCGEINCSSATRVSTLEL